MEIKPLLEYHADSERWMASACTFINGERWMHFKWLDKNYSADELLAANKEIEEVLEGKAKELQGEAP